MASSPFAFYRGAAALFAHDLAHEPVTGIHVQQVGDAHLANFGFFATPERDQVFDADDFDETLPGPWEWDVKRLAVSLVLVAQENRLLPRDGRAAARGAARSYREHILRFATMRYVDLWYTHLDQVSAPTGVSPEGVRLLRQGVTRARARTGFHAFPELARLRRGGARLRDAPPLLRHYRAAGDAAIVRRALARYQATLAPERRALLDRYHLEDVAEKVVGVGSVGTRCAVGLFLADDDVLDPLLLQVKEALPAVSEPYVGRSVYRNQAERVVIGQRLVQEASDVFLGWSRSAGHDFYVRQLRDMKFAYNTAGLRPRAVLGYAELCGFALARAHARTGDPAALAGYLGEGVAFDRAIGRFAERYAAQVRDDQAYLVRAIRGGRVAAESVRS